MKNLIIGITVVLLLSVGGWYYYSQRVVSTPPAATSTAGLANPASVNCVQTLGGTLQIVTAPDGSQLGYCHLSDGRMCEEWSLFRDHTCVGPTASTSVNVTASSSPMPNTGDKGPIN